MSAALPPLPVPVPWLAIVGIGEDGRAGLSPVAAAALDAAEIVWGGRRHLALAAPIAAETRLWPSPIAGAYPEILARRGRPTCLLATGDPFHYGIGAEIARLVPIAEIRAFPQPSAFSLAAARLGWPLAEAACLSLHGRALSRIVPHLQPGARLVALSWDETTPAAVAALLVARGLGASRLSVLEAMGGPRERVRSATAAAFDLDGIDPLNTLAVEVEPVSGEGSGSATGPLSRAGASRGEGPGSSGKDAPLTLSLSRTGEGARGSAGNVSLDAFVPLSAGLDDGWFEHDGQLTKSEIRAATLAALRPLASQLLWDVGAGAGSVAIEWCLRHRANRALAIEARPDRAARIRRNAEHLGVAERVTVVEGQAPTALADLPRPAAIFLGGGVSEPGLLSACREALPAGGRLVANAVTLEGEAALLGTFADHGGDLRRFAIARAAPVGGRHGWRPAMPVTQWAWGKP